VHLWVTWIHTCGFISSGNSNSDLHKSLTMGDSDLQVKYLGKSKYLQVPAPDPGRMGTCVYKLSEEEILSLLDTGTEYYGFAYKTTNCVGNNTFANKCNVTLAVFYSLIMLITCILIDNKPLCSLGWPLYSWRLGCV